MSKRRRMSILRVQNFDVNPQWLYRYSRTQSEGWSPTACLATGSIFFGIDKLRDQAASWETLTARLPRSNNLLPGQGKTKIYIPQTTFRSQ